jgi:hypothetical protein
VDRVPCPKCGRPLHPAGELTAAGVTRPVYQCDECTQTGSLFGETLEEALTFAVNPDGTLEWASLTPGLPGGPPPLG